MSMYKNVAIYTGQFQGRELVDRDLGDVGDVKVFPFVFSVVII